MNKPSKVAKKPISKKPIPKPNIPANKNVGKEFNDIVSGIQEEERAKMNDAVTSEDGVVYGERLLAGYIDEDGALHETFAYRETTGLDEEAINKPEIKSNPGRVLTTLAERCVIEIGDIKKSEVGSVKWSKIIKSLYIGDLNYINFKIRELSKGKVITFTHQCPTCHQKMVTEVDTEDFEIIPFDGDFEKPFKLRKGLKGYDGNYHKTGFVRLMNGEDGEVVLPILKKNTATGMTALITRLISMDDEGDGFKVNKRMVANMSTYDRDILTGLISDMAFGVKLSLEISCTNCGEFLTSEVGTSDFFS